MRNIRCGLVVLAVLFAVGVCEADESTDVGKLWEQGNDAYKAQDYRASIGFYREVAASGNEQMAGSAWYNIACCYGLLGEADSAFATLQRSIANGFTNCAWIEKDSDLTILREDAQRWEEIRAFCQQAWRDALIFTPPVAVLDYPSTEADFTPLHLFWDDPEQEALTKLREEYHLDSIAASGDDEYQRMLSVMNWVSHLWQHTGSTASSSLDALSILAAVENGERFRCVEYAVVLANCLVALGYPARVIGLASEDVAFGSGKGHVCTEVWSNQFDKWILMDPQNNAVWLHQDVPQNAGECRKLLRKGNGEALLFTGWNELNYEQAKAMWASYFFHLSYTDENYYFEKSAETSSAGQYELLTEGVLPVLYFQGSPNLRDYTDDWSYVYPQMNRVRVRFWNPDLAAPVDSLKLGFTNTMPWFDFYIISINGVTSQTSESLIAPALRSGENVIEITARNTRGITGPAARLVLRNNLDK